MTYLGIDIGTSGVKALLIDRAARTHFLLEGEYPARLEELVERQLVPPRALKSSSGGSLAYRAEGLSYTLMPQNRDAAEVSLSVTETISGDFAVDPDFFRDLREEEGIPLVLLD